jgi:hypothetical protein
LGAAGSQYSVRWQHPIPVHRASLNKNCDEALGDFRKPKGTFGIAEEIEKTAGQS